MLGGLVRLALHQAPGLFGKRPETRLGIAHILPWLAGSKGRGGSRCLMICGLAIVKMLSAPFCLPPLSLRSQSTRDAAGVSATWLGDS